MKQKKSDTTSSRSHVQPLIRGSIMLGVLVSTGIVGLPHVAWGDRTTNRSASRQQGSAQPGVNGGLNNPDFNKPDNLESVLREPDNGPTGPTGPNNEKSALDRLKETASFRALQKAELAKQKVERIEREADEDMEHWALSGDPQFDERRRLIYIEKRLLEAQALARKNDKDRAVDDAFTERLNELQQKLQENRARDVRDKVEEIMTSSKPRKQKLLEAAKLLDVDLVGKGIYPPEVEEAFNKASKVWFDHRGRSASRRNGDGHRELNSLFYEVVQMSLMPDYFPESTIKVNDWDLRQASKSPEGRAIWIKALPGAQDRLWLLEMRDRLQQERSRGKTYEE